MPTTGGVTLLFTDLVGSTELAARLGEAGAEAFRLLHFGLLRGAAEAHGGHVVKNLGDGMMVAFGSAADALAACVAIQEAVTAHNRSGVQPRFAVRIGAQAGDPVLDDGDYFGTPVIVAKRLCDRAAAGQVLVGAEAAERAGDGFVLHPLGALDLKGLPDPVPAAELVWDPDGTARPSGPAPARPAHVVRPPALAPPPDGFFGREAELGRLSGLLRDTRLVSIIGPGGVGKTRLSGHLVDAVAAAYPDGVWCCALASLGADDDVTAAVATVLRVERRAGSDLADRVVEFLAGKRALLVLDNCEQVVDGAADLAAAVLAGTSAVSVVVTSREALGVPGEHRLPLDPLEVVGAAPAVELFLARAGAAGARPSEADLPAVRELCRRVDGLPLAIELAAARAGTSTVAEIVADVTDRLADLAVRRGRDERHRSIHALVDWSYDLLGPPDRRLFERMAVFAGGADAEAVAAVVGDDEARVADRLRDLADQSLVSTRHHDGTTRYALLEPVRAYAERRLRQGGDEAAAREAHARHFVDLTERADAGLTGPEGPAWNARLQSEFANLRAAHQCLVRSEDGALSLRLVGALFWYGFNAATTEVSAWAYEAAERFAASRHPSLPLAWGVAAWGPFYSGDLRAAAELAERSISAAGADRSAAAYGHALAGVMATVAGDIDRAVREFDAGAELGRVSGDRRVLVAALGNRALALAHAGRDAAAQEAAESSMAVALEANTPWMLAWAYYYAGESRLEREPTEAAVLLRRCLTESERAGNQYLIGAARLSLVSIEVRLGSPEAALPHFPGLIDHWQRCGAWTQQWLALRNLVVVLADTGHPAAAATLYGAMTTSDTAPPVIGGDARRLDATRETLRRALGEVDLTEYQRRGAELGDGGAVAYAREVLREILDEP